MLLLLRKYEKQEVNDIVQNAVDDILQEDRYRKMSVKNGTGDYHDHDNTEEVISELCLYEKDKSGLELYMFEQDKFSLDESRKEWRKCVFGRKLNFFNEINIFLMT